MEAGCQSYITRSLGVLIREVQRKMHGLAQSLQALLQRTLQTLLDLVSRVWQKKCMHHGSANVVALRVSRIAYRVSRFAFRVLARIRARARASALLIRLEGEHRHSA